MNGLVSPFPVTAGLAGRSLLLMRRVPTVLVPSLIFPIFIVVAFSGAYGGLTQLPGFPVDDMIDWMLPMAVVQGAAFSGVNLGLGMVREIETGFFDRLLLAPVSRWTLLAGPIVGGVIRALIPSTVVLVVGLLTGAHLRGGVLGALMLYLGSTLAAVAAAGWGAGLALRFRSMKAAPLMQMGIFLSVFLSTAQVPLSIMTGWLRTVARLNPVTRILGLARQGFVGDVTWADTWPGLLAGALLSAVLLVFAVRGLRTVDA